MLTALSFDDGYAAHLKMAQLLARKGIRATFYCITHLKSFEGKPLLRESPRQIREIAELGHEIGSHTCTHPNLLELSVDELDHELKESKHFLEDVIGREVPGLAYPYGYFNSKVLSMTRKHYRYARLAAVYDAEDVYNTSVPNRYMISALTVRHIPALPVKIIERKGELNPVLFAHNVHVSKIIALILYLRILHADFVTVEELVAHLSEKGIFKGT